MFNKVILTKVRKEINQSIAQRKLKEQFDRLSRIEEFESNTDNIIRALINNIDDVSIKMISTLYLNCSKNIKQLIGNPIKFICEEYKKFPTDKVNNLNIAHIFASKFLNTGETVICFHYKTVEVIKGKEKEIHKAIVYFPTRGIWLNSNGYTEQDEKQLIGVQMSTLKKMFKESYIRVNNKLEVIKKGVR